MEHAVPLLSTTIYEPLYSRRSQRGAVSPLKLGVGGGGRVSFVVNVSVFMEKYKYDLYMVYPSHPCDPIKGDLVEDGINVSLFADHSEKDELSVLLLTSATAAGGALKSKLTRTIVRVKVLVSRERMCNTPVPEQRRNSLIRMVMWMS